jgi:transcriptional regulator with XRE-family HTH domain
MMQPIHLRMARAALGWSLSDLADRAKVNLNTISRYEAGREVLSGTIGKIEKALEIAGIALIQEDDLGGPGIRMQKPFSKKATVASRRRSK